MTQQQMTIERSAPVLSLLASPLLVSLQQRPYRVQQHRRFDGKSFHHGAHANHIRGLTP
jgi:hypothetical protein